MADADDIRVPRWQARAIVTFWVVVTVGAVIGAAFAGVAWSGKTRVPTQPPLWAQTVIGPEGTEEILIDCAHARDCLVHAGVVCPHGFEFKANPIWPHHFTDGRETERGMIIIRCGARAK